MNITLNGTPYDSHASNLAELITELNLENKRFALEMNKCLIPKSQLHSTPLENTAVIEIVHAVGGG